MRRLTDFIRSIFAGGNAGTGRNAPRSVPDEWQDADRARFAQARAFHQQGQLGEAEALYRELLSKHPVDFDLLHLLGVVLGQRGDVAAAIGFIERAVAIEPGNAAARSSLGNCLKGLNRLEEALASYDRALELRPDDADTLGNRGAALRDLKRPGQALESYDRALAINPGHLRALDNRGAVLRDLHRPADALASHDKALAVNPGYAPAYYNRGIALCDLKRYDEARESFERALSLNPADLEAFRGHGAALHGLERHDEALASYEKALALRPDHVETLVDRGTVLRALRRHEDALASFDRALGIKPDHAVAHFGRGVALGDMRRYQEAIAGYDKALALRPDYVEALNNRGSMLRSLRREKDALSSYDRALSVAPDHPSSLFNRGNLLVEFKRLDEAIADFARLVALAPDFEFAQSHLLNAKMSCCDWRDVDALWSAISGRLLQGKPAAEPFFCLGAATAPDVLKRCGEIYSARKYPPARSPLFSSRPRGDGRIRLGYLSGEFRHQATSILMVELLERHDAGRFELYAFDNGWDDGSDIRRRINRACAEVVDISRLGDVEAATGINKRKIDVLVNVNGYFGLERTGVFALRPAPVQVNWLGFPGTMGTPCMDYIVGDAIVIPPGHEGHYSEKVVRLPDCYQVNDSRRAVSVRTPTRAELKLPERGFVFCCFNNNFKITPEVFGAWMRVLSRVEHSVLWLLEDNPAAARNLRAEAVARGVAAERLVFAPRMELADHLARHRVADLFLDTLPCNAHTTASDALWAGLPVLTCMGETFAGRVAGSLLHALGLPELITENLADYEAEALRLATMPALLADLRSRLDRNRATHALFDGDRFRKHIESAYAGMYERWARGEAPAGFSVPSE